MTTYNWQAPAVADTVDGEGIEGGSLEIGIHS
jgi:hypothetical protein